MINEREELLVVCERHRRNDQPYYKLPGGALQPGEHLVDAVLREVLEETGVHASFEALVCFRHWHGYRYGKSDIYFVCRLSPLSQDLTDAGRRDRRMLLDAVTDYFSSDLVSAFNKRIVRAALASPGVVPGRSTATAIPPATSSSCRRAKLAPAPDKRARWCPVGALSA